MSFGQNPTKNSFFFMKNWLNYKFKIYFGSHNLKTIFAERSFVVSYEYINLVQWKMIKSDFSWNEKTESKIVWLNIPVMHLSDTRNLPKKKRFFCYFLYTMKMVRRQIQWNIIAFLVNDFQLRCDVHVQLSTRINEQNWKNE